MPVFCSTSDTRSKAPGTMTLYLSICKSCTHVNVGTVNILVVPALLKTTFQQIHQVDTPGCNESSFLRNPSGVHFHGLWGAAQSRKNKPETLQGTTEYLGASCEVDRDFIRTHHFDGPCICLQTFIVGSNEVQLSPRPPRSIHSNLYRRIQAYLDKHSVFRSAAETSAAEQKDELLQRKHVRYRAEDVRHSTPKIVHDGLGRIFFVYRATLTPKQRRYCETFHEEQEGSAEKYSC